MKAKIIKFKRRIYENSWEKWYSRIYIMNNKKLEEVMINGEIYVPKDSIQPGKAESLDGTKGDGSGHESGDGSGHGDGDGDGSGHG